MKVTDLSLNEKSSKVPKEFIALAVAVLLLSANYILPAESLRKPIAYAGSPLMKGGVAVGKAIDDSVEAFFSIPYIRSENAVLQITSAELEAENRKLQLLLEENAALRKEIDLGKREDKLLEANVLASDIGVDDSMIIDAGKKDGVEEGDIVRIGSIYIGYIGAVSELTSKVILPNNETSTLEVLLIDNPDLDKGIEQLKEEFSNRDDLANGLALGENSAIKVDNISRNDTVQAGYAVVVNDPEIQELLYIGSVSEVIDDPAAPVKRAKVRPAFVYDNINYLFVVIE
ncbi:MAG: rod shape-determining protein MreC [Candidatus Dojkabacteria bacterium]|nr:MAG: rod shape-determining protein MreC [Candidatus Dojkabacteria bacterium]